MKIKVISTPSGQAPEWVRKAWVGIELEATGRQDRNDLAMGVRGGRPDKDNIGGYVVDGKAAVEAVKAVNPMAARWWKENAPFVLFDKLMFGAKFCQEIG